MTHTEQLRTIMDTLEGVSFDQMQSPQLLMDWGFKLMQWISYSGAQQAAFKQELHKARRKAMVNLVASLEANGADMAVSLQKQYIDDQCDQENYNYTLAERCNRTCTHSLDFVRTCISLLKMELSQTR